MADCTCHLCRKNPCECEVMLEKLKRGSIVERPIARQHIIDFVTMLVDHKMEFAHTDDFQVIVIGKGGRLRKFKADGMGLIEVVDGRPIETTADAIVEQLALGL